MRTQEILARTKDKAAAHLWAKEIVENPGQIVHLVSVFCQTEDYRLNQRLSWLFSIISEKKKDLFEPFQSKFLSELTSGNPSEGLKRNILRLWVNTGVPEALEKEVFYVLLDFILGNEAIAVTCHGMTVGTGIAVKYPDFRRELYFAIEKLYKTPGISAGIRSRAGKSLKSLSVSEHS